MALSRPINSLPIENNPQLSGYTIYEDGEHTALINFGTLKTLVTGDNEYIISLLSGETVNRISGDTYVLELSTGYTSEQINELNILLSGETVNRISGDTYILNLSTGYTSDQINQLNVLLSGETINRIASNTNVLELSTGYTSDQINQLKIQLSGETINRISGDTYLNDLITGETFNRISGDTYVLELSTGYTSEQINELNILLSGETVNRINSDKELNDLITGETFNRIYGDTYLNNLITGETVNRINSDNELNNQITGLTQNLLTNYVNKSGGTINGSLTVNGYITSSNVSGTSMNTGDEIYNNYNPTQIAVGGIPIGSTFSGKTVSQMFDSLLYPELFPTLTAPSNTFTVTLNTYYEVGYNIPTLSFNASFNRGSISPAYGTSGYRSGLPTQYNYTGVGLTNTVTTSLNDSKTVSNYIVSGGANSWGGSVSYSAGEQPLSNKGNNYNTPLSSGTTSTTTRTFTGIYPFLYGMSASVLDGSTLYSGLSGKLLEIQGNKTVTLNGNLQYIYFIYPATYADLVSIIDNNGFNVTGSFTKSTVSVTSSGLGSNWTTSYKVYRTTDQTTVLNGQYQFKFN